MENGGDIHVFSTNFESGFQGVYGLKVGHSKAIVDEDNRLLSVEKNSVVVVSYLYDSASRLLQRIEGGTTTNYIWDGWDLVREEKTGTVTETTDYLCPDGEVLAFKRGSDWYYLHGDALSSTQLVTDESGAVVGRYVYGAWGEELVASESIPGLFENRFVGGLGCRRDSATGLIYMRHRWYDPDLQRFISRDPIGFEGSWNLYEYAANAPLDYVDALGLNPSSCSVTFVDGAGFTGLDPDGVPNHRSFSNASSDDFVNALETEPDIFIYTGHHRRRMESKLRLSDGDFGVDELFRRAKRLPRCVFINGCNTFDRMPKQGEYSGTTFISVDRFVNMKRALRQSKRAAEILRGPNALGELRRTAEPGWNFVYRNAPWAGCNK